MSFAQPAVMVGKDADSEILAAIDAIEFDFGPERFTMAQAELLSIYETGFELDCQYMIALSKNYGIVIFSIPYDLMGRIMERAGELHCSAGKYLAELVEFRQTIGTIVSVFGVGVDEADYAVRMFAQDEDSIAHDAAEATAAFRRMEKALHAAYMLDAWKWKETKNHE